MIIPSLRYSYNSYIPNSFRRTPAIILRVPSSVHSKRLIRPVYTSNFKTANQRHLASSVSSAFPAMATPNGTPSTGGKASVIDGTALALYVVRFLPLIAGQIQLTVQDSSCQYRIIHLYLAIRQSYFSRPKPPHPTAGLRSSILDLHPNED